MLNEEGYKIDRCDGGENFLVYVLSKEKKDVEEFRSFNN